VVFRASWAFDVGARLETSVRSDADQGLSYSVPDRSRERDAGCLRRPLALRAANRVLGRANVRQGSVAGYERLGTGAGGRVIRGVCKLAVVEGIEASDVLGCGERGKPSCTPARINTRLDEIYRLGVRSFFPIHKFDTAAGGTKMDAGDLGLLIDLANRYYSGHFWKIG
jgi:hypothetical protein